MPVINNACGQIKEKTPTTFSYDGHLLGTNEVVFSFKSSESPACMMPLAG